MKLSLAYISLTILNIAAITFTYRSFPRLRPHFVMEDHFLENLEAYLYVATFVIGMISVLRLKETVHRRMYMAIPLIGLLCFLDEVSYGARIFNINVPVVSGVKVDGIHDFVSLIYLNLRHGGDYVYIFEVVAFLVLVLLIVRYYKHMAKVPEMFKRHFLRFVLFFAIFGILALAADAYHDELIIQGKLHVFTLGDKMFVFPKRYLLAPLLEELMETNAALALLFASLSTLDPWRGGR